MTELYYKVSNPYDIPLYSPTPFKGKLDITNLYRKCNYIDCENNCAFSVKTCINKTSLCYSGLNDKFLCGKDEHEHPDSSYFLFPYCEKHKCLTRGCKLSKFPKFLKEKGFLSYCINCGSC